MRVCVLMHAYPHVYLCVHRCCVYKCLHIVFLTIVFMPVGRRGCAFEMVLEVGMMDRVVIQKQ